MLLVRDRLVRLARARATTAAFVVVGGMLAPGSARAADGLRSLEFRFTPVAHAQMALWIESGDGAFLQTVRLTQSVSYRGIGNRPGASQMNSGYHWPYGRREGALPIWAHRRAAAPNAAQWKRVIFQNRLTEGLASRTSNDFSVESYFCLSFAEATNKAQQSTRLQALDAVTCASGFNSDKGRFITADDVAKGYAEPLEVNGVGTTRALDMVSLYPPRRDVMRCTGDATSCNDTPDVDGDQGYAHHALAVMPELDAVTMATPPSDAEQSLMFSIPDTWPDGDYVAWIEVNREGDYNDTFNDVSYPTPLTPAGAWDSWAEGWGYPYRGQPSVAYQVPFTLGPAAAAFSTAAAIGYGDVGGFGDAGGDLHPMGDGLITDDPVGAPGSGADRLQLTTSDDTYRFKVKVGTCPIHAPPAVPEQVMAEPDHDARYSHEWGLLHFVEPTSDRRIDHYEVRTSLVEIAPDDPDSFMHAMPAVSATLDPVALFSPGGAAGNAVDLHFGGLLPLRHYWVAIRAVDECNLPGPVAVAEMSTTKINFTKLSGCFIATAAYGSALGSEVQALRRARDALVPRSTLFATAVDLYYRSGPVPAAVIGRSEVARAAVRELLGPWVAIAGAAERLMGGAGLGVAVKGFARPAP